MTTILSDVYIDYINKQLNRIKTTPVKIVSRTTNRRNESNGKLITREVIDIFYSCPVDSIIKTLTIRHVKDSDTNCDTNTDIGKHFIIVDINTSQTGLTYYKKIKYNNFDEDEYIDNLCNHPNCSCVSNKLYNDFNDKYKCINNKHLLKKFRSFIRFINYVIVAQKRKKCDTLAQACYSTLSFSGDLYYEDNTPERRVYSNVPKIILYCLENEYD
jgi:hypothetical protein